MPVLLQSLETSGRCKVLLHNDNVMPMTFVVLGRFFDKAAKMPLSHASGAPQGPTYAYDVAETKVAEAMDFSRQLKQPLQCTMEKE